MPFAPRLRSFLRSLIHRNALERQMADELEFHLAARAFVRNKGFTAAAVATPSASAPTAPSSV